MSMLVGIAGGTGSGKSTVARRIAGSFESGVMTMDMDSYYRDLSHMTMEERRTVNFDHPDAFDTALFVSHLEALKNGEKIEKPIYSFAQSVRERHTQAVHPSPIIIVEGILVLAMSEVREVLDAKIFVDTDDDIRIIRRIERDVTERGRSLESVIQQYVTTVRPMHLSFVEPTKRYADIVVPHGGNNDVAIRMLVSDLKARLDAITSGAE
jgi:uridine kinase